MISRLTIPSFFRVAAGEYEHLHFSSTDANTATLFIYAACLGIILAALCAFYQQKTTGAVVRALLRAKALSPECAKTAEELGLAKHPLALRELAKNRALARVLQTLHEEDGTHIRYYIKEEDKYRAELRFDKRGNGTIGLITTIAFSFLLSLLLIKLFPVILQLLDHFMA